MGINNTWGIFIILLGDFEELIVLHKNFRN